MKFRPPFIPGAQMVARVPFRYLGVEFLPGDDFPGDKLSEPVSERRFQQLYASRHIEQKAARQVEPQAPAPTPPIQQPTPTPAPVTNESAESTGEFSVVHKGFGKFTVLDPSGAMIEEGLPKELALKKAAALNLTRRGAGGAGGEAGGISAPSEEAARAADPEKAA